MLLAGGKPSGDRPDRKKSRCDRRVAAGLSVV